MNLNTFGHTDIGRKRQVNEDNFICHPLSVRRDQTLSYLLAAADGMGGHVGGELASSIAVDTLKKNVLNGFGPATDRTLTESRSILERAIQKANEAVFTRASEDNRYLGMATTLVAAIIDEDQAVVSNIGDSRAYLIRHKHLEQITIDHNWKTDQIRSRNLSEEDIINSPFRDLVTRALGLESQVSIDTFSIEFQKGDYLLLCTDGLYSLLTDKEIPRIFRKYGDPKAICRELIRLANERGGHDNITAVIAHFSEASKIRNKKADPSDTVKLDRR